MPLQITEGRMGTQITEIFHSRPVFSSRSEHEELQKLIYDERAISTTCHFKPLVRFAPLCRQLEVSQLALDDLPPVYGNLEACSERYTGLVVLHVQGCVY